MLNVVFGWCEKYCVQKNDNKQSFLTYWELIWFDMAIKVMKQNIFEIVKAADFYDIAPLITSLGIYLGKEFQNEKNSFIFQQLFVNSIYLPLHFAESVMYQILLQKEEWNMLQTNFVTKRVVNPIFKIDNCVNLYNEQLLSFRDFVFFKSLHGNHIQYDQDNEFIKNDLQYKEVSLNINQTKKVRHIMESYLLDEELNTAIVAGGCFWDYIQDSLFAKSFPNIYNNVIEKQDIDIFILDDANKTKYMHYYETIFETFLNVQKYKNQKQQNERYHKYDYTIVLDSDKIYDGVDSFKISHHDGQIINFIFVSADSYASTILFLDTFDFSISKTYYSYETDALYLPIEIFGHTAFMCTKYQKKVPCVDVYTIMHSKFQIFYSVFAELCEYQLDQYGWVNFVDLSNKNRFGLREINDAKAKYIIRRKTIFMVDNRHKLKFLGGCGKMLYRIFKYGFKNNFKTNEECLLVLNKIERFYSVLKREIDENCFNSEKLTESIFEYILNFD